MNIALHRECASRDYSREPDETYTDPNLSPPS